MTDNELFIKLKALFPNSVKNVFPWPEPYCRNLANVKAIVLGADPSYYERPPMAWSLLKYVFGLEDYDEGRKSPYFEPIHENLKAIGLSLDNIFVQNVCRNYFIKTTYDHKKVWKEATKVWIPYLKAELDHKFPDLNTPVLLTTEIIYEVLLNEGMDKHKAISFYDNPKLVPITAHSNALDRPLIPLYRHFQYTLVGENWKDYSKMVREFLGKGRS